jgi:glycosyltransferase involved in cell wall biosynthesis
VVYRQVFDSIDGEPVAPRAPSPDVEVVGMVGRIAPWKGQDVFLRAFAQAFPGDAVRAVIVGAPLFGEVEYADTLLALAAQLGIADRVEFRGFRADTAAEYRAMDVFVHASTKAEPFGLVVVEAMAAGLPVVAVDGGGPAETITHGHDGLLYPLGDVDALAAALVTLRDDGPLRARIGGHALERAADFGPARLAREVSDVYREALAR